MRGRVCVCVHVLVCVVCTVCVHVCVHAYMCMCVSVCVFVYVCVCIVCVRMQTCTHVHRHTCTTVPLWQLKDNFKDSIFSFHYEIASSD